MGFGLLILGYITVLGVLPESFIYYNWGIYIAVAGGILMLMGFRGLEEFNVYFKAMKYITVAYIFILLGFSPFVVPRHSEEFMTAFTVVSKIIRICFMFVFHFYLLQGISALAKEINNIIIEKKAKRNIIITYIFFSATVFVALIMPAAVPAMILVGLIYFALMVSMIYSCYMRITYAGHDEAIEKKYNLRNGNRNRKREKEPESDSENKPKKARKKR